MNSPQFLKSLFATLIVSVCITDHVADNLIIPSKTSYYAGFSMGLSHMKGSRSDRSIDVVGGNGQEIIILNNKKFNANGISVGVNVGSMIPVFKKFFFRPDLHICFEDVDHKANKIQKYKTTLNQDSFHNLRASIKQQSSASLTFSFGCYFSPRHYGYIGLGPHIGRVEENLTNITVDQNDASYTTHHSKRRLMIRLKYVFGYGFRVSEKFSVQLEGHVTHPKTIKYRSYKAIAFDNQPTYHETHSKYRLYNAGASIRFSFFI
jgi:hypothetical protein